MEKALRVMSNSGFSALGAGVPDGRDNELIEAPEEDEEFDVLNDETFGNYEEGWDEDEHERLVEMGEDMLFDLPPPDHTKDSGYGNAERSYRSQEEFLEESISRLMEDEAEDEEKGKYFFAKGQPIPQANQHQHGGTHLDQLFGPSSPPALLDTEHLVSPKSKNIWGSPASDSIFHKPAETLRKLFDTAKAGQSMCIDSSVSQMHHTLPPQSPAALPQAHTLEEIERQMLSRGRRPQVLTATELERRLRGEECPREYSNSHQVVNYHPQIGPPPPHLPPGLLPAAALTDPRSTYHVPPLSLPHHLPMHRSVASSGKPPAGMNAISQHTLTNGRSSPIPIKGLQQHFKQGGSPQMNPGPNLNSSVGRNTSTPTPPLNRGLPSHLSASHSIRLISPYSIASASALNNSPVGAGFASRMMSPAAGLPRPVPRGPIPNIPSLSSSPMGTPPNVRVSALPSMQDLSLGSHLQQQPLVDKRLENHGHHGIVLSNDKHRAYRTNYQRPPPWQKSHPPQQQHQYPHQGEEIDDEYAGLMTKKEKDWIIKIQLLQLNTDNPYLDDYYYTYYMLRKKQMESGNTDGMAQFLIPNLAKIESRAYTPAQFEGSLGRLTTASVHNPRHIIDITRGSSPSEDSSKKNVSKELRKFRQLLMDIEKGYIFLLDIDDIEKKVLAVPEDSRLPLFIERFEKIRQLYQYFTSDESIEQYVQILGVRKGRKLLGRVLPLFSKNQAHVALCILFHHMHSLVKKDTADDGLILLTRPVYSAMEGSDLESLVRLVNILKGENPSQDWAFLLPLFRNQFSAVILCGLLNQAELVFKETSPVDLDNQMQTEWNQFVEEFAEGLNMVPLKDLPSTTFHLPLVEAHLSRQLKAQLLGKIEEKIHLLITPSQDTITISPPAS